MAVTVAEQKKLDQLVEITVDDSLEKIVQLDTQGKRLRFNPDPDLFKRLAADELAKLSEWARFAYQIARDEWQDLKDKQKAEEADLLANIEVGVSMGRATQRLHIDGKQQGYEYHWIRPDERNEFLSPNRGWKVVQDGPERTLSNQTGRGPHVIGTKGSEELILVKRIAEARAAERRAKKHKRNQRLKDVDTRYEDEVKKTGVPLVKDEDDDGRNWRDRTGKTEE
jgi:hypothetical protein